MISKGFYFPSKIEKNKGDRDFKEIKELRSDCSTGASHVPVKSIKLVATDLDSPPAQMIIVHFTNSINNI